MARIHRTAVCQFAGDLVKIQESIFEEGVGNVGKWTSSDAMETGCRGKNPSDCRESVCDKNPSDCLESVCERLRTYTAKYILSSKFEYG